MERKVLILLMLIVAGTHNIHAKSDFWSLERTSEAIAESMTTSELVGQVLMLGYTGVSPSQEFLEFVRDASVGGVKVFGWNSGNLEELATGIGRMQEYAAKSGPGIPLFVATDQEGGWVRHVKGATSDTPGNLAIGASGLALDAYNTAYIIGRELSILGINMNFAPTVDVYTNPDADVIGPRAFSSDPVDTAFLALAFLRGLENAGIVATAKHFPGHGNTAYDSHGTLPVIDDSLEVIWKRDLLPYRMLIPEGLPAIMSGHLAFPRITGHSKPATLSEMFLRTILRDRMSYEGLIITDDMRMDGVLQNGNGVEEACELALRAGNDIIMISRDFDLHRRIYDHLVTIADADALLRKHLVQAVGRILKTKRRYLAVAPQVHIAPERVYEELPYEEGQAALFDLACRSVAVLRPASVPIESTFTGDLLLVGQYSAFFSKGLERFEGAKEFPYSFSGATREEVKNLQSAAAEAERIIFCLANATSLELLEELEKFAGKITVFSVLTPVYLRHTPWVLSAIATFGRGADSFQAGFAVLSGDFDAEGTLPVSLEAPKN